MRWDGGRRSEAGLLDAGLLPAGHEARQVLWVGEEGEDELDGIGEPLHGLEGIAHREGLGTSVRFGCSFLWVRV